MLREENAKKNVMVGNPKKEENLRKRWVG